MAEVDKYTATRGGPGTVRDPLDATREEDDASDENIHASSSDDDPENATGEATSSAPKCASKKRESMLNQFETPLGLDPTATPDFVQHVAAFKTRLELVQDAVKQMHVVARPADANDARPAEPSEECARAAAEEVCERAVVDLREAAGKLDKHQFEEKAKLLDNADNKAMLVPGNKLLSMFDSATWTQCLSEFWYGDALPNMSQQ